MSWNAADIARILGKIGDLFGGGMKRGLFVSLLAALGIGGGINETIHQIKKRKNNGKQQEKEDIK